MTVHRVAYGTRCSPLQTAEVICEVKPTDFINSGTWCCEHRVRSKLKTTTGVVQAEDQSGTVLGAGLSNAKSRTRSSASWAWPGAGPGDRSETSKAVPAEPSRLLF